jgi:hypothetical protein
VIDRPALYLALSLYVAATAFVVVYVARTARFGAGLVAGTIALFGYLYPSSKAPMDMVDSGRRTGRLT